MKTTSGSTFCFKTMLASWLTALLSTMGWNQCPSDWTPGKVGIIQYQYWKPKNYDQTKKYPLVTVFHGAGGISATNNDACNEYECQVLTEDSNLVKRPCFILAPKCPSIDDMWVKVPFGDCIYIVDDSITDPWSVPMPKRAKLSSSLADVLTIMNNLIKEYSIDTTRLYLLGASMGGFAQWDLLCRFPRKFAAAFPLSGGWIL